MRQFLCAVLVTAAPVLAQVTLNGLPTREFGQPTLVNPFPESNAPNLVEGRELYSPSGIAFDTSVTPPHVYIVDTGNNRVLGWSNAKNVTQGTYADLVIGQPDFYSTFASGPGVVEPNGASSSTGLNRPTGIAVDASGNVYVADSGNNRILRFKTPYLEQAGDLPVDLVIGQKTASSGVSANQGLQSPSSSSLALYSQYQFFGAAGLAIDGSGNLWVADVLNNRVLGFPSSQLVANNPLPKAAFVIGQTSFNFNQLPSNQSQSNLAFLADPTSVAADSQGNLYVSDQGARVIQYLAPIAIGESGKVVLGIPPTATTEPVYPTASTLGSLNAAGNGFNGSPQGVFVLNGAQGASVFVCDSPQNRVVRYDTFAATWAVAAPANSPIQNGLTGQPSSTVGQANQGQINPSNATFSYPVAGAIRPDTGDMWIVDQSNNRVVAFAPQGGGAFNTASQLVGQTDFIYGTANLIVGSEIWVSGGGGVAIDSTSTPPHLYVADTLNNRILAFNNAYNVGISSGMLTQKADLVIGQADLLHSTINSPNGAAGQPSATGLYLPVGVAVDASGNLWVADSGNGRALRFPAPFAQPAGSVQTATVVLGQPDFATFNQGVSQFLMTQPYGLAIFSGGGAAGSSSVAVSDAYANRILVFNRPTGGDFMSTGQQAQFVVGQTGFTQAASGSGSSQLNTPLGLGVDSSDRLYVADSGNNRLQVFSKITASDPSAPLSVPGLNAPHDVVVSALTGYSWVTNTNSSVIYQLPEYGMLDQNPSLQAATQQITTSIGPLALALDPSDNLVVADSANRLTFYFAQLYYRNTASYAAGIGSAGAGPAANMLVEIALENSSFNLTPSYGTGPMQDLTAPWPPSVNNIQVTVNGVIAPIFRVDRNIISFLIPNEAGQSGPADFAVTDLSTGQVLAVNSGVYNMQPASPGIYTANSQGTLQVAANAYDSKGNCLGSNCVNSSSNPVSVGGYVGLWLTGAGYIPGLPADGTAPGLCNCPIQGNLVVYVNGTVAPATMIVSPQYPGLWQVNVQVPAGTPSSTIMPISVIVELGDAHSNVGAGSGFYPNGSPGPDQLLQAAGNGGNGLVTTIYVK